MEAPLDRKRKAEDEGLEKVEVIGGGGSSMISLISLACFLVIWNSFYSKIMIFITVGIRW